MKRPKQLTVWDFRDTIQVPVGYDMKSVPDMTRDNFNTLLEEHNNLVMAVNEIVECIGLNIFEEDL